MQAPSLTDLLFAVGFGIPSAATLPTSEAVGTFRVRGAIEYTAID